MHSKLLSYLFVVNIFRVISSQYQRLLVEGNLNKASYNDTSSILRFDYNTVDLADSISKLSLNICNGFAHPDDDNRCFANAHQSIRTSRVLSINNHFESFSNSTILTYPTAIPVDEATKSLHNEWKLTLFNQLYPRMDEDLISYSYFYDASITQNHTVCLFGCFNLRLHLLIKLFGSTNSHFS